MLNRIRDNLANRLCRFLTGSTMLEIEWDREQLQSALTALQELLNQTVEWSEDMSVMLPRTDEELDAVGVLIEHGKLDYSWSGGRIQWARFREEEDV